MFFRRREILIKSTAVDFGYKKMAHDPLGRVFHQTDSRRNLLVLEMLIQVDLDFLKLVKDERYRTGDTDFKHACMC